MGNVSVHGAGGVTAVNGNAGAIQIGGRNLILDSGVSITGSDYLLHIYKLSEPLREGEYYVSTIWGVLGNDKDRFLATPDGTGEASYKSNGDGSYTTVFTPSSDWVGGKSWLVFHYPENIKTTSTITKIKLELGTVATDWSLAPEDILSRLAALEAAAGITYEPPQIDGPEIMDDHGGGDGDGDVR